VRFGLLQFGLAEFHDGTEAQIVTGLSEIQAEVGLFAKLLGNS
jgi:hypothetical protein